MWSQGGGVVGCARDCYTAHHNEFWVDEGERKGLLGRNGKKGERGGVGLTRWVDRHLPRQVLRCWFETAFPNEAVYQACLVGLEDSIAE